MRLKITHRTEYRYDVPVQYALQRFRLVPLSGPTQTIGHWALAIDGAREELRFLDHFGNDTRLVSIAGETSMIGVEAVGEVETMDKAGVTGAHRGFAPLWLFCQETALTAVGGGVAALVAEIGTEGSDLDRLHRLMGLVGERVAFRPGSTSAETPAEAALAQQSGVCQDHTHIFCAAARRMGYPARYVSGYLMMDVVNQVASHAWAEAHVDNLGWVAFDAANGISPDERYVRLATGRDFRDASPVSGILLGQAQEQLAVHITVEQ